MNLCTETITVFNALYDWDLDHDTYHPTVIRGVSWYSDIAANVDSDGLQAANKFTIRIPVDADFNGKEYAEPNAYNAPDTQWTLANGDFIARGEVTEAVTKPDDVQKKHETVTVLGVTDNRRAPNAKHWKVTGA